MYSSRQYILTAWPAFVGPIVALAPDPSSMVYENIWWSALFAIASGGLAGLDAVSPPHRVEAHSEGEGQMMCESWQFKSSMPKAMSKEETMESFGRGIGYNYFEWAAFIVSFALWLLSCLYFGYTLRLPLDFTHETYWLEGAAWYYISASPAVAGLILELMRNRID